MSAQIVPIEGRKTDQEVAIDIRDRVQSRLSEICALLDEARSVGMRVEFILGLDAFGRNSVQRLDISKPLV